MESNFVWYSSPWTKGLYTGPILFGFFTHTLSEQELSNKMIPTQVKQSWIKRCTHWKHKVKLKTNCIYVLLFKPLKIHNITKAWFHHPTSSTLEKYLKLWLSYSPCNFVFKALCMVTTYVSFWQRLPLVSWWAIFCLLVFSWFVSISTLSLWWTKFKYDKFYKNQWTMNQQKQD